MKKNVNARRLDTVIINKHRYMFQRLRLSSQALLCMEP